MIFLQISAWKKSATGGQQLANCISVLVDSPLDPWPLEQEDQADPEQVAGNVERKVAWVKLPAGNQQFAGLVK